jgi:hypothetical protein
VKHFGPNFARRAGGKRAKASGSSFEGRLAQYHDRCASTGLAVIDKCSSEVGGHGASMYYKSRAPIDYAGVLADGRAIFCEAKATSLYKTGNPHGCLPINAAPSVEGKEGSGIRFAQYEALRARARMKAVVLILWYDGLQLGVFRVPNGWVHSGPSMSRGQFRWLPVGSLDYLSGPEVSQ